MEQIDSCMIVEQTDIPENGLKLQPALSPDEEFDNILNNLLKSKYYENFMYRRGRHVGIEERKQILVESCSNLTRINFNKVMEIFRGYDDASRIITEVLLAIVSKSPNMSNFQMMAICLPSRSMSEEMLGAITKMTKLEVLGVGNFSISFSSLMELSGKLPSLKQLYFNIEAEPNFAIVDLDAFQKSFGSLDTFQFSLASFGSGWRDDFRKSLTLECVRYLPNLRRLGDPGCCVDMLLTCFNYQSLATTDQSKLTQLTLRVDREIGKKALSKFPDVNDLHIWAVNNKDYTGYQVPGLLEFQHLTQLSLSDLDISYSVYVKQFLEVYGKRLKMLVLKFQSHPIDFVWLFNMICCNSFDSLEMLVLMNFDVQPSTVMTVEGKSVVCKLDCEVHQHFGEFACKSLKDLELEFASKQTLSQAYVHLSKILSVPNLEKVRLIRVPTTLDELRKTLDLVAKRSILEKVTRFELELSNKQMTEREIDERIKWCETIEELLCDKKVVVRIADKL